MAGAGCGDIVSIHPGGDGGDGSDAARAVENAVDILFVIDDSATMDEEQRVLMDNFDTRFLLRRKTPASAQPKGARRCRLRSRRVRV